MRFPGREVLFMLCVTTIIIPLEVIVIPLFMTVNATRGLVGFVGERPWTLAALSVPFAAKAFNIFLLRQYFLSLPRSLEEAAFLDGAGWWSTFWRVALPNAKPAIVAVVLLDFVVHWNDFLWPLVICLDERTRTIQWGLGSFFTQPPISWGAILAYAVMATIPMMIVFALGQRWIVQSLAATGIRE
jgi:multiple sugar transport system permease protein/fructooligosaccharide transport system permease protein